MKLRTLLENMTDDFALRLETMLVTFIRNQSLDSFKVKKFEFFLDSVGKFLPPTFTLKADRILAPMTFEVEFLVLTKEPVFSEDDMSKLISALPAKFKLEGEQVNIVWKNRGAKTKNMLYNLHSKGEKLKGHEKFSKEFEVRLRCKMFYEDEKFEINRRSKEKVGVGSLISTPDLTRSYHLMEHEGDDWLEWFEAAFDTELLRIKNSLKLQKTQVIDIESYLDNPGGYDAIGDFNASTFHVDVKVRTRSGKFMDVPDMNKLKKTLPKRIRVKNKQIRVEWDYEDMDVRTGALYSLHSDPKKLHRHHDQPYELTIEFSAYAYLPEPDEEW